jgi:hypothetical protein
MATNPKIKTPPKPTYGNFLTTGARVRVHMNWQWDSGATGGGYWQMIEGTVDALVPGFLILIPKGGAPMAIPHTGYNFAQLIPQ